MVVHLAASESLVQPPSRDPLVGVDPPEGRATRLIPAWASRGARLATHASVEACELVAHVESVGTLPSVAAQVLALAGRDDVSLADFERVVRPDAGLTALLLRWANSARFRPSRELSSVRDALGRLGVRGVSDAALALSFQRLLPERLHGYGLGAREFWEHAVLVAQLSDELAQLAGFSRDGVAFTAGLLHDVGKAVVARELSSASEPLRSMADERRLLGTDHCELGAALLRGWKLPDELVTVVSFHHACAGAPTATSRYVSTAVYLADQLAHADDLDGLLHAPEVREALERLDLSAAEAPATLSRVLKKAQNACASFVL